MGAAFSILLLSSLSLFADASPVAFLAARKQDGGVDTEPWSIPSMKMHFFTENTGMNWPWDEGHVFPDSTLDFELSLPATTGPKAQAARTASCHATWPITYAQIRTGTLPPTDKTFTCTNSNAEATDETITFTMRRYMDAGERRPELGFVLSVHRTMGEESFVAETPVTAFMANTKAQYNYLTCLSYAPYTGMQCGMHSVLDNGLNISLSASVVKAPESGA